MKKTTFSSHRSDQHETPARRIVSSRDQRHTFTKKSWYKKIFSRSTYSFKRIIGGILMLAVITIALIWGILLRDLPDIHMIEQGGYFTESTVLYDKNGQPMYSFSENGKRTYVAYSDISPDIVNALISTEDRGFFENPGVDILGMGRAVMNYVIGKDDRIGATSTLSQQLVRNTILTNERSLKRKIQEMYLAYQLNQEYSKEKILEMYLNAIEFGSNAKGVEQAAITFFGKNARDVGPLGASILASLPKSPTRYSPYLHRDLLMGKIEAYPTASPTDRVTLSLESANGEYNALYSIFKEYVKNLTFEDKGNDKVEICHLNPAYNTDASLKIGTNGCATTTYETLTQAIGSICVSGDLTLADHPTTPYTIEYTVGRKDIVASLMLGNGKIDGATFGKILYDGLEFQFQPISNNMKYPYFVMYVKEYLENTYGTDINIQNGLKVYTTLDPDLQEYAEQVIREQAASNKKTYGASSASLISMDNTTGRILAMVGGPDYFDTENGGNNNMTTALRQPGSSFKALIYALAISKNPIGIQSPIADVETKFGNYTPNNYDGKYNGIMTVGTALAYSRNIPAVKMYFLAGREESIVPFAKSIGINSLDSGNYGASLALGAGEVRAIDMMQAFSVFANNGVKRDIYAIERIEDANGGIIEEHTNTDGKEVFSPVASYIISKILSDNNLRPQSDFWRNQLTIKGKTVAAKTGTSNKPAKAGSSTILPGDTWTIGYSPTITTVVWAGNVDGSALKGTCDGINCAAPAWNKFMTYALANTENIDFTAPKDLIKVNIVKASGLLPTDKTPSDAIVSDIMAVKLTKSDGGYEDKEFDSLCGGPVTSTTPADAIIKVSVPTTAPIIDGYDPEWTRGFFAAIGSSTASTTLGKTSDKPCERPEGNGNVTISSRITGVSNNIFEVNWTGDRAIKKIIIESGGKVLRENELTEGTTSGSDRVNLNQLENSANITITLIDIYGYRYSSGQSSITNPDNPTTDLPELPSIIEETENNPSAPSPTITLINPARNSINLYAGDMFNLRFQANVHTTRRAISVAIDGNTIQTAKSGELFVIPVPSEGLSVGDHSITISVVDANNHSDVKKFTLTILPR